MTVTDSPSRTRRVMDGVIFFVGIVVIFAVAVWAIVQVLGSRAPSAPNACTAQFPDGTTFTLSAKQTENAALIAAIGMKRELPARAITIALATALQESRLENIDYGDRDSLGLFQQRPSQGWGSAEQVMDPVYATEAFYEALVKVPDYESLPITEAAQAVQISGHPEAYAQHEELARAFASALTGWTPAALNCHIDPAGNPELIPGALGPRFNAEWEIAPEITPYIGQDGNPLPGPNGAFLYRFDVPALIPSLAAEPERGAMAIAAWLVAQASVTEIDAVYVGDKMWSRHDRAWIEAGDLAQPAGVVVVSGSGPVE